MVNELNEIQQININIGFNLAIKMVKDIPDGTTKEETIDILSGYLDTAIQALKGES
jgi:hypothetical protein